MQVTIQLEGNNLGEALAQLAMEPAAETHAAVAPVPATPKREKVKEAAPAKTAAPVEKVTEKKEETKVDGPATGEAIPEQRKALIYKLIDAKGKPVVLKLLAKYGATKGSDLPDDKYPAFYADLNAALAE